MTVPLPCVTVTTPLRDAPSPLNALGALASRPHAFLRFAAGGPRDLARWSFAGSDPVETLVVASVGGSGRRPTETWERLRERRTRRLRRVGPRVPFTSGWFGTIGYETRSAVERVPPAREPADGFPAVWLGRYDAVVAWDHRARRAYLCGAGATRIAAREAAARLLERLRSSARRAEPAHGVGASSRGGPSRARATVAPAAYRRRVASIVRRIRDGDLFQANLSQRFEGTLRGSPLALFRRLCARTPAPFATYLDVGGGRCVLSASPERFVSLSGDVAETRPMKGTRPRGATAAADRRLLVALERSVKDRAELAMIVDLSRNDLGRVCRPGTVEVVEPRRLERYATVFQAVAVVRGRLRGDAAGVDLVAAAFPPGSVTGAPKVEAMKVIDALEGEARGPYCGAIGWLDDGGDLDLAVAIRTVCVAGESVSYRVGGGVTLLSDPEAERVETLHKGAALAEAIAEAGR